LFQYHINFYANKAISTIKCMKILGNLSRGLIPLQKRWLYMCYVLLIALYRFQLWYYNKAPLDYPLKVLRKMQWKAALWISSAFLFTFTSRNYIVDSISEDPCFPPIILSNQLSTLMGQANTSLIAYLSIT